eukprot:MONOS_13565.1-p1 / transcript=MONOS_13565.1 / gene=MONOS_13565 / organism=Monocercomonoides_exilis_PA203 / gene_product=unspecified product / transcript_product=unspecified product / location=Mono_scaffold00846:10087-10602(-) / protein_length=172 / sequence_SO=supercontig / SO=protein_coding / is_pseudo=false
MRWTGLLAAEKRVESTAMDPSRRLKTVAQTRRMKREVKGGSRAGVEKNDIISEMEEKKSGGSSIFETDMIRMLERQLWLWMQSTTVEMEAQGASREPHWRAEEQVYWSTNIWWARWKVIKVWGLISRSGSVGGVGCDGGGEGREVKWRLKMRGGGWEHMQPERIRWARRGN